MKRKYSEQQMQRREASIREHMGLDIAHAGDESGVRRFAYLMETEVGSLAFFTGLPQPVKGRLRILGEHLRDLKNFMDGRVSAIAQQPPATPNKRSSRR